MDRYVFAITWRRTLQIYWAHTWRGMLVVFALSFVAGMLFSLLASHVHVLRPGRLIFGSLALFSALILCVGTWSMKRALQVSYAEFAVSVTPVDAAVTAGEPTIAPMTARLALPVFWAMSWRAWLIVFPVSLLAGYWFNGTPLPLPSRVPANPLIQTTIQLVIGAAACIWALRIALNLQYGNWRLQLVPKK